MRCFHRGEDPYRTSLERAIRDQMAAGVHLISDGQTRTNMVDIFASRLAGIRMKGKPVVFSEVRYSGPITVADQRVALSIIGRGHIPTGCDPGPGPGRGDIPPADPLSGPSSTPSSPPLDPLCSPRTPALCDIFLPHTWQTPLLKGIITGPHTLSQSVRNDFYPDEQELAFALARALNREARTLQQVVPVLQIDEPFFSVNYVEYAGDLMAELLKDITIPVSLHVCGDITPIFEDLLEMPVSILDHEFTLNTHLPDLVRQYDFHQMLGFGVVRSDLNRVEPVEWIEKRIQGAVEAFGAERIILDPDCGLRHLSRETAYGKLRNIRIARDRVMEGMFPG